MKRSATQRTVFVVRTAAVAALLATLALTSPGRAASGDRAHAPTTGALPSQVLVAQAPAPAAPSATQAPVPAAKTSRSKVDRVESRITMLHAKLAITPAQEDLWKNVTQAMRDNAQKMEALTKARADKATAMTAIDDLRSYAEIAEAHADGLKQFVPVFEPLYASMSESQKANANTLFRSHGRSHMAAKKNKGHVSASPDSSTK
jgi:periplasmic protein CpxP/Spy